MVRVDLLLSEEQVKSLKSLPGTLSEHIRNAITTYLELYKATASVSPSRKGGKQDE